MRAKKTVKSHRPKRPAAQIRFKRRAGAKASTYFDWVIRSRGFVFAAAMFVIIAAALLTAREDVPRTEPLRGDVFAEQFPEERMSPTPVPREREAVRTIAPKPAAMPAPQAALTAANAPARQIAEARQMPEQDPERVAAVTISGCVDGEDDVIRLVDASGEDAPKSRSWKSGFLKKRAASITLEDSVGTLGLRSHDGRRVAVTGTLIDREMRARSLRVLGSCE